MTGDTQRRKVRSKEIPGHAGGLGLGLGLGVE